MSRRHWSDLSGREKRGIGLAGLIQVGLLIFALQDWFRRPADQIRGPKRRWFPVLFLNFIGPITYLTVGRRR